MRIIILGPVVCKQSSGGVAVFNESLFDGFVSLGDNVQIISISKSDRIHNIVIGNGKKCPNSIPFFTKKIAIEIKKYKPDVVVSSLQYSLGIKLYKRLWPHAKYVQVLHGYPCPVNGWLKSKVVNSVAKYSRKHFDYLVTVSYVSYAINKQINGVICDKIIHNCIDSSFSNKICNDRKFDFVYVGRLHPDKNIEMIGDAFLVLKQRFPNIKVAFAGYGELEPLFSNGRFAKQNSGFEFFGKIDHEKVFELLHQSRFFVSLAPNEAFGIAIAEAVASGCNVITNITAGISELLYDKPFFHCTRALDFQSLAYDLEILMKNYYPISNNEMNAFLNYMSCTRMAREYKEFALEGEKLNG